MIKIISLYFALYLSCDVFAQSPKDTLFLAEARKSSIDLYTSAIRGQAKLFNGSQYVRPEQTSESNPYFLSDDWAFGTVEYDGEHFDDVPLLYDISSDKVVTEYFYNANEMELVYSKLSRFTLAGHVFEKILTEQVNNSLPQSGFYDILYAGPTKTIVRRQKQQQENISSGKIEIEFEVKNRYFIFKDGAFHPVKSKGSVLKLLADQKGALRQHLKKSSLYFKRDRDKALTLLTQYYDTLKTRQTP
jgi:hypothetical protein